MSKNPNNRIVTLPDESTSLPPRCFSIESVEDTRQILAFIESDYVVTCRILLFNSAGLDCEVKNRIDKQVNVTLNELDNLRILLESARGRITERAPTRLQKPLLRDWLDLQEAMERLLLAHSGLILTMRFLRSCDPAETHVDAGNASITIRRRNSTSTMSTMSIPAPPYALSLHEQTA